MGFKERIERLEASITYRNKTERPQYSAIERAERLLFLLEQARQLGFQDNGGKVTQLLALIETAAERKRQAQVREC